MTRRPRRIVGAIMLVGFVAGACSEEDRERIRAAASSVTVALPTALLTPTEESPTQGPAGSTSQPTEQPTEEPTTTPIEEPTTESTEVPTTELTEAPGGGDESGLVLAIIGIVSRLQGGELPEGAPSPTEAPETTQPSNGPTAGPTGTTARLTGPTGATGSTGAAGAVVPAGPTGTSADSQAEEIAAAAASTTSEDSTWFWLLLFGVLAGVGWFLWWRARRERSTETKEIRGA
jgi:hypothetical protein